MHGKWRLLDLNSADPKMNLAINETIFTSRYEGLTEDTLHLWQCSKAVIFSDRRKDIDQEACQKLGAEIVRAISIIPDIIYQDNGSINFAVATNAALFAREDSPVLSAYQILNEAFATGLQEFDVSMRADSSGVYANEKKISENLPIWFHHFLLFQGTLRVNTDLNAQDRVVKAESFSRKKTAVTSLGHEIGEEIPVNEVKEAVLHGLEKSLSLKYEKRDLIQSEQKLADKLYRIKYAFDGWNVDGDEPFLTEMGKTTVEVFVAYPPTEKCRKLIRMVNDVASNLQSEVKVAVWMQNKDQCQNGPNSQMSSAIASAHKRAVIPAVIINGKLTFADIPSKEEMRKALLDAL